MYALFRFCLVPRHVLWRPVAAALLVMCLRAPHARAGLGPENVAVVVNGESWASLSVANAFCRIRNIPDVNVIVLSDVPADDTVPSETFRSHVLIPVLELLRRRKLDKHVDCIAYSADFPYAIDASADFERVSLPKVTRPVAALTGFTYLYQGFLASNGDVFRPEANWYARTPRTRGSAIYWTQEEKAIYLQVQRFFLERSVRRARAKQRDPDAQPSEEDAAWERQGWLDTAHTLRRLGAGRNGAWEIDYNLACALAQLGQADGAIAALKDAVKGGFHDLRHAEKDTDLDPLRKHPEFVAFLDRLRDMVLSVPPGRGFSAQVGWTPEGAPVPPFKGAQYILSSLLGYTSGRGNSYEEVIASLERSAGADGSEPEGTVYIMTGADVRQTTRRWAVATAAHILEGNGVAARAMAGKLPMDMTDVAGLMTGSASLPLDGSDMRLRPGAFCDNLTSFGGILSEGAGQTPLTAFIRHGAAGASGTVVEPFALQAKFPTAMLQGFYSEGYSLAEAFYQSVASPYQILLVGDPLCAPWKAPREFSLAGLPDGAVLAEPADVRTVLPDGGPRIATVTYFVDGQRVAAGPPDAPFTFDPESLPDGHHVLSVLATGPEAHRPRAREALRFEVRNLDARLTFDIDDAPVIYGDEVEIPYSLGADGVCRLYHLGRKLAEADDADGRLRFSSREIGLGTNRLVVLATLEDGAGTIHEPLEVTTALPPALPGETQWAAADLAPGVLVEQTGGGRRIVQRLADDWLGAPAYGRGTTVRVSTWVTVAEEGIHQLQFRGNCDLSDTVSIDGNSFRIPRHDGWRSLPVALAKGTHWISFGCEIVNLPPKLHVRFGLRGTQTLGAPRAMHPAAMGERGGPAE